MSNIFKRKNNDRKGNKKYIPPNRKMVEHKKIEEKKQFIMENNSFPSLGEKKENTNKNNNLNYKNVTNNIIIEEEITDKVKPGWVAIKREGNKTKFEYGKKTEHRIEQEKIKEELENERKRTEITRGLDKMIDKYYEFWLSMNYACGDTSPYWEIVSNLEYEDDYMNDIENEEIEDDDIKETYTPVKNKTAISYF